MVISYYSQDELAEIGFKRLGENVKISRKASIYSPDRISIGDHVRVDDFCILSGNIVVGNYVHIAAACLLFGGNDGIILEDFSGVSSRSALYAESDDYSGICLTLPTVPDQYRHILGGGIIIKKYAIIGTGCTLLPGSIVGEGSAVGSMSLVLKPIDEWGVYVGIPCQRIKDRDKHILKMAQLFMHNNSSSW